MLGGEYSAQSLMVFDRQPWSDDAGKSLMALFNLHGSNLSESFAVDVTLGDVDGWQCAALRLKAALSLH